MIRYICSSCSCEIWALCVLSITYDYLYLSLDIYLSSAIIFSSFLTVFELFCGDVLEAYLILSANLLPIKSPVASACFWIALFEAVLSVSVTDNLAWSRSFWLYLLLKFILIFLPIQLIQQKIKTYNI